MGRAHLAEDLAQETLLRGFRALHTLAFVGVEVLGLKGNKVTDALGSLIVLAGVIRGCVGAYRFCWHNPGRPTGPLLTADVERDVRARFMPYSDRAADNASIQPDKRGLKPEGQ
jgi:hypothetical protein